MAGPVIHSYPIRDIIWHDIETDDGCPCGPQVIEVVAKDDGTASTLIVHHILGLRSRREIQPD